MAWRPWLGNAPGRDDTRGRSDGRTLRRSEPSQPDSGTDNHNHEHRGTICDSEQPRPERNSLRHPNLQCDRQAIRRLHPLNHLRQHRRERHDIHRLVWVGPDGQISQSAQRTGGDELLRVLPRISNCPRQLRRQHSNSVAGPDKRVNRVPSLPHRDRPGIDGTKKKTMKATRPPFFYQPERSSVRSFYFQDGAAAGTPPRGLSSGPMDPVYDLLATIAAAVLVLGLVTKAKAGRKRRASRERADEQSLPREHGDDLISHPVSAVA
jgi:hypothetical protein